MKFATLILVMAFAFLAVYVAPTAALLDKIVYDAAGDIFTMNLDGSGQELVAEGVGGSPHFSPDTSQICYINNLELFIMNADGSDQHRIVEAHGADVKGVTQPFWAANNRLFYRTVSEQDNEELFSCDADGGNEEQHTDSGGRNMGVAYVLRDISYAVIMKDWDSIHEVDLSDGTERKIIDSPGLGIDYMESPTYDATGSRVTFDAGFDDEFYDIWYCDTDGGNVVNLTNGVFNNQNPYWATPTDILFNSDSGGDWDIYSGHPDTLVLTNLTNTPDINEGDASYPQMLADGGAGTGVEPGSKLSTTWGAIKSR